MSPRAKDAVAVAEDQTHPLDKRRLGRFTARRLPMELIESSEGPAFWGQLRESTWKKRSVPSGIRTRVTALKGLGPGPD
jgi:hypothetical protein